MKVKIGDTWYSSDETPICIQIDDTEQSQIADMPKPSAAGSLGKYAKFGDGCGMSVDEMRAWMKDEAPDGDELEEQY